MNNLAKLASTMNDSPPKPPGALATRPCSPGAVRARLWERAWRIMGFASCAGAVIAGLIVGVACAPQRAWLGPVVGTPLLCLGLHLLFISDMTGGFAEILERKDPRQ